MKSDRVTENDIDELLAFLPAFEEPGRDFVVRWKHGRDADAETLVFPHPVYCDDVVVFFVAAGKSCWSDFGYDPRRSREMLDDDELIRQATLDQVKSMLTYCVRGERFCDGHWEAMLRQGRIVALLRRLKVLRAATKPR